MSDGREPASGRVRGGRSLLAAVVGLGLLASLPFAFGLLAGEDQAGVAGQPVGPVGEGPAPGLEGTLTGRLAYVADDPASRKSRLWVLDLETGSVTEGTTFSDVDEIHAAGPVNSWIVVIGSDGADSVGYLVRDPAASNGSAELARGDLVSISTDGNALLVVLVGPERSGDCPDTSYELRRLVLASFLERTAYRGRLVCGRITAATLRDGTPIVSVVHRGRPEVHLLWPGDPVLLFHGLSLVAASAHGSLLLEDSRNRDLLFWPGGGAPRPVVRGSRTIPERILAWSGDSRYIVLDGAIGDEEGTWLVDVAGGTAERFPPAGYPLTSAITGAVFADDGTLFAIAQGHILASTGMALFPVSLPAGVPYPIGPVAWLP